MAQYRQLQIHQMSVYQSLDISLDEDIEQFLHVHCFAVAQTSVSHTHATVLQLSGFCLGQPGLAGTKRNIHPLTPIVVISHPLSASFIYYNPWHPPFYILRLFPQSPSFLWSFSWPGILLGCPVPSML